MRLLCPVCHIDTLVISQPSTQDLMSHQVMSVVGAGISKALNFHPIVGAVAGVAVSALAQGLSKHHPHRHWYCGNCKHYFIQSNTLKPTQASFT